jgi:hypothetical protein
MMRYTFIGDGSSDKALMRIIDWSLSIHMPKMAFEGQYADFRYAQLPPKDLAAKVAKALELYPCDILFVHRDGEQTKNNKRVLEQRKAEIQKAIPVECIYVPVIPIKMMETWLLTNKQSILKAAGNQHAKVNIDLPALGKLETFTTPKEHLHELLRVASGLKGRRYDSFNVHQAVHLIAEYSEDFNSLKSLDAFKVFELDLRRALNMLG